MKLICSFCGKATGQVGDQKVVKGQNANICSECMDACNRLLMREVVSGWEATSAGSSCSFCGKEPPEVTQLYIHQATDSVRICGNCLRLCNEVLA